MSERIVPVPADFQAAAKLRRDDYERGYANSVRDPEAYWRRHGQRLAWSKPFTRAKDTSYALDDFHIRWFADGELNVAANCLDRHLAERGDKIAIIWEPDDPKAEPQRISYRELHARVCRLANALEALGVVKGDRITIYLPMIPEAAVAMLACARIGAIHSVVFGGFAPKELATRLEDCKPKLILSASCGIEVARVISYKPLLDEAIRLAKHKPQACLILQRPQAACELNPDRDHDWHKVWDEALVWARNVLEPEPMLATDPL
ncbi:MAG TPA: AMP-binding protein, partial [Arenimonas sp.]|nr:AMP-binding protein [Arenimonas sp.]